MGGSSPQAAHPLAGIDVELVSAWIAGRGIGERPPLRFKRIGNGLSNLTFLVSDADGRSWVLRRPPLGELLDSAHDVVRESGILTALERTPVPAPRVFGLCDDRAFSPVPLLLMEYVDGLVIDSLETAERLPPPLPGAIGRSLPTALAKIHAVDPEATGLDFLSTSRTPYAARQIRRWRGQWEGSRTRDLPAVDALADRLWAAMPPQDEICVVHGDFHLLNVIVSPANGEVMAVLDWELCTLGNPLADLGSLLAYWTASAGPAEALIPFGATPGFPSGEELVEVYAEASGRSLDALGFWHALALWKIAVIVEGVLWRSQNDPRNAGSPGALSAEQVDKLVARAVAVAAKAGI